MKHLLTMAAEYLELSKTAARENRKTILKRLERSKKIYDQNRLELARKQKVYDGLGSELDQHKKDLNHARDDVHEAYDILRNMDLVDVNEVKLVDGKEVAYVKDKRLFKIIHENGEAKLEPYRRKEKSESEESKDVCDACGIDHEEDPSGAFEAHKKL